MIYRAVAELMEGFPFLVQAAEVMGLKIL